MKEDNVDVLSSHAKFTRMKKNANEADFSDVDTHTYEEFYPKDPQQTPEPSAVSQRVKPSPGSKVRVERVVLVIVCFLLFAALAALRVITCEYIKTKEMLRSEKVTGEADKANLTEMSSRCDPGWEPYGAKCYYFSVDRFPWEESKQRCMNLNGTLVKIDSRDEQTFLAEKLKTEMEKPQDRFWIGLTDSAKEGEWRWVDGSELDNDLKFWYRNQPDDYKEEEYPEGEDCVRMGWKAHETVLYCWFDKWCRAPHKMICEKAAERGKM